MNKVKGFFIAAALLLTTAGVFAGKARFSTNLYISVAGVATEVATSSNAFTTVANTHQAFLYDATTQYTLYSSSALSTPLYAVPSIW